MYRIRGRRRQLGSTWSLVHFCLPDSDVFGLSRVTRALACYRRYSLSFSPPNMFFARASLIFIVVSFAAIFCAQSVEAARGPKVTSKVYFDIKHGDEVLGRSTFTLRSRRLFIPADDFWQSYSAFLVAYVVLSQFVFPDSQQTLSRRRSPKQRRTSVLWQLASGRMVLSSTMATKAPNSTASSKTSCT